MEYTRRQPHSLKSQQHNSPGNRQSKRNFDNRPEFAMQAKMIDSIRNSPRSTGVGVMQRHPVIQRYIDIGVEEAYDRYITKEEVIRHVKTILNIKWSPIWNETLEFCLQNNCDFKNAKTLVKFLQEYSRPDDYKKILKDEGIPWEIGWDIALPQILDDPQYVFESGRQLARVLMSLVAPVKRLQNPVPPNYFKQETSARYIDIGDESIEIPGLSINTMLVPMGVYIRIMMPPVEDLGEGVEIGFIQIVQSSKMSSEGDIRSRKYNIEKGLPEPSKGVDETYGWSIDRSEGAKDPFYGMGMGNVQSGSNTRPAIMWDNPACGNEQDEWFPRFKTCVVVKNHVSHPEYRGKILAAITWGFNKYSQNRYANVSWIDIQEENIVSEKFATAIQVWNTPKHFDQNLLTKIDLAFVQVQESITQASSLKSLKARSTALVKIYDILDIDIPEMFDQIPNLLDRAPILSYWDGEDDESREKLLRPSISAMKQEDIGTYFEIFKTDFAKAGWGGNMEEDKKDDSGAEKLNISPSTVASKKTVNEAKKILEELMNRLQEIKKKVGSVD